MKLTKTWFALPLLASSLLLTACGDQTADNASKASQSGAEQVIVGTGNAMLDIAFLNEDDELDGYDVELLREIDQKLDDVDFKFEAMEFTTLLLNLESKKIDLLAHNMAKNAEREEKFLFNERAYNSIPTYVVVHESNNTIQSIDDLKGKTVGVTPTSNAALFFEKYNKEHNLGAKIKYIKNSTDLMNQLKTGRIDATFSFPFSVKANNEGADAQQKLVGDELLFTGIYFMFNKENKPLADKVDGAIEELIEDGTVGKLLTKWFDEDYSANLK